MEHLPQVLTRDVPQEQEAVAEAEQGRKRAREGRADPRDVAGGL